MPKNIGSTYRKKYKQFNIMNNNTETIRPSKRQKSNYKLDTATIPNELWCKIISFSKVSGTGKNYYNRFFLLNRDLFERKAEIIEEYNAPYNYSTAIADREMDTILEQYEKIQSKIKRKEILELKNKVHGLSKNKIFLDAFINRFYNESVTDPLTWSKSDKMWSLLVTSPHLAYTKREILEKIGKAAKVNKNLKNYCSTNIARKFTYSKIKLDEVINAMSLVIDHTVDRIDPARKKFDVAFSARLNNLIDDKNNINLPQAFQLHGLMRQELEGTPFLNPQHVELLNLESVALMAEIYLVYKAREDSVNANTFLSMIEKSLRGKGSKAKAYGFIARLYKQEQPYLRDVPDWNYDSHTSSILTQDYSFSRNHYFSVAKDAMARLRQLNNDPRIPTFQKAEIANEYKATLAHYVNHCIEMGELDELKQYIPEVELYCNDSKHHAVLAYVKWCVILNKLDDAKQYISELALNTQELKYRVAVAAYVEACVMSKKWDEAKQYIATTQDTTLYYTAYSTIKMKNPEDAEVFLSELPEDIQAFIVTKESE